MVFLKLKAEVIDIESAQIFVWIKSNKNKYATDAKFAQHKTK